MLIHHAHALKSYLGIYTIHALFTHHTPLAIHQHAPYNILFIGVLETITEGKGDLAKDVLVELFRDGKVLKEYTFTEIRQAAKLDARDTFEASNVGAQGITARGRGAACNINLLRFPLKPIQLL
jgi:hypothetical protein